MISDHIISRQTVTHSILKQGQLAKLQFQKLFQNMAQDPQCTISGIVDFWSARQTYLMPYGGIIACGLDQNWKWITFPRTTYDMETNDNTRYAKASQLPFSIPTKSTSHEWRSYYRRFHARLKNYSHYYKENDEEF